MVRNYTENGAVRRVVRFGNSIVLNQNKKKEEVFHMKKVKHTILGIISIFILFAGILISNKSVSAATIEDMKNKFPHDAYWNHVVKEGHGYSNYQDYGSCNNPDGYTWTPCDTHNGNVGVGGHDCNSFKNSMQCCGFAKKLAYDLYGSTHTSWGTTSLGNAKVGDVIHYKGGGADVTWGHWAMIIGINGNTLTFGECNVDINCRISWGRTFNIKKATSYKIYSAPWAASLGNSNSGSNASAKITFKDQNINHTWETNAEVYVKIMNPNKKNVSKVGCYLYDANGSLLHSYQEDCNLKTSYVNYTCNFNNDMKYTLTPGTTYKYVLYAIVNDIEYKDSVKSFKTTGTNTNSTKDTTSVKNAPKKVTLYTPSSLLKKRMTIYWKKVSDADGYQIEYATNNTFSSAKKITVSKLFSFKTIKKLTSKKTYYVRIRAYKVIDDKKVYGRWSNTKSYKVK